MFLRPLTRSPWCLSHRLPHCRKYSTPIIPRPPKIPPPKTVPPSTPLSPFSHSPLHPSGLSHHHLQSRTYTASPKPKRPQPSPKPPPFPIIPSCPSPTCACSETPAMPQGLEIDHSKPLNGTMPAYAEQVLICTGKDDWPSRIEDENSGDNLAADIKELVGRGGVYSDPYHNISITNSSFPSSIPQRSEIQNTSAYLFPSFKYIPFLPRVSFDSVQALVKGYLLPRKLHPAHDGLSPIHRDRLVRSESAGKMLWGARDVREVMVLICGHGGRDGRCGAIGPVLREEFERQLKLQEVEVLKGPVDVGNMEDWHLLDGEKGEEKMGARVGLISHIGGHKFAGNVILYIPPDTKTADGKESELAGKGIWYGRVEPKHVEGIVRETVRGGRVIKDLFRGGIGKGGEVLRL